MEAELNQPELRLKQLGDFSLHDLEVVRLILRGGSVVDWHRLNFQGHAEVKQFIRIQGLDPDVPTDREYIRGIQDQAVRYLKRSFGYQIPKAAEEADVVQLALMASGPGGQDQHGACAILKVMQIINHMAGRELLFRLPLSDRDLFHLVEEKVYRIVGTMLNQGFPIAEFVGGRKNLDSTYTKLLSKRESTAIAIYDKLRFRIVTRTREQLMPVLLYLSEHLFPFNYVVPEQSTNTIFHFRSFCEAHPHLSRFVPDLQITDQDALTPGDNRFSAPDYRTVQFIADLPVRVPDHLLELAPPGSEPLGKVVYMLCEIQLMDAETEAANETGTANHRAYKERQLAAVSRRLRLSPGDQGDG